MNFLKAALISIAVALPSSGALAQCFGTTNNYNCYDYQSGNHYTVNRFGNTTTMQGSNARTGSTWSQTTTNQGGFSHSYGTRADGTSWNYTQPRRSANSLGTLGYGVTGGYR